MTMGYKAIIVGCGRIAGLLDKDQTQPIRSHARAYHNHPEIDVICCVDIVREKARALADKFGGGAVEKDFKVAIEKHRPHVISICTPDETHFDIVMEVLQSGYAPQVVFLEKPACRTLEQLDQLITVSEKKGIDILVNHTRRFDEKHNKLKKLIREKFFGDLVRGDIFYYSGWLHNGVHIVDTLNFIFNDEVLIESVTKATSSPYPNDPTLDAVMRFKEMPGTVFLNSFDEKHYQLFEFDLKFDRARLRIEDFGSRIFFEKRTINELKENVLIMEELSFPDVLHSPMQLAIEGIVQLLRDGNRSILLNHRLTDVIPTMKTLLHGVEVWKDLAKKVDTGPPSVEISKGT